MTKVKPDKLDADEIQRLFDANLPEWAEQEKERERAASKKLKAQEEEAKRQAAIRKKMKGMDARPKFAAGTRTEDRAAAPKAVPAHIVTRPVVKRDVVQAAKARAENQRVALAEGNTTVPSGSPRRALLEHLKSMGGSATVEDLSKKLGLPLAPFSKSIKPLLSGLIKGGWIKEVK